MRFAFLCLVFVFSVCHAFSQTKIYGQIVDTISNTALRSVSISIYPEGLKTVEQVGLTDRFGKFSIEGLSREKIYRLELSHQGYQKWTTEFSLSDDGKFDFGKVHLERQIHELDEVLILPPVRMNGDTIEFNADAFLLDTNAVVEDLIHKLPGMIIWGDGKITYNGKEVLSVWVNGKEFFGTDRSISLQNIAKEAVQKVQVYDARDKQTQQQRPLEPQYEMNVVLKEGQETMLFGNVTVGPGTDQRYEHYLNMNYSDRKTQSTLAYTSNNTNKRLNGLDQLLRNTTFKGVGIHADYQPDFNRFGITRQHALAGRYQHDFLATKEINRKNMITGNVFSNWERENMTNTSSTIVAGNETDQINKRHYESMAMANTHALDGQINYELTKEIKNRNTRIQMDLKLSTSGKEGQNSMDTDYDYHTNQSRNIRNEQQRLDTKTAAVNLKINWDPAIISRIYEKGKNPNVLDRLRYELIWNASVDSKNSLNNSDTQIDNRLYPEASRHIQRIYNTDDHIHNHHLSFEISNKNQNIRIGNPIHFSYSNTDRNVQDLIGTNEVTNPSLSHVSNFRQLTYTPRIEYRYKIFKRAYSLLSEELSIQPVMSVQLLNRRNVSTLDYRNIDENLVSYLPRLGLDYYYHKHLTYSIESGLVYYYNEDFPTLDLLQPIYDDRDPAFRYFANPGLSRTIKNNFNGYLRFAERNATNLSISFNTTYDIISKGVRDSIIYAPNQQRIYSVNMEQDMYDLRMGLLISRPFRIHHDQTLTFDISGSSFWSRSYFYIDSELQESAPIYQSLDFTTYYTNSSRYQLSLKGGYTQSENRNLTNSANSFSSVDYHAALSLAYALTKKLKIGSNIKGHAITSHGYEQHLTIWNADIAYRFSKGNHLEAKFAVFDILDQNKGIYIYSGITEMTTGYRNNLRQFFQLSVSYFPRKFGL